MCSKAHCLEQFFCAHNEKTLSIKTKEQQAFANNAYTTAIISCCSTMHTDHGLQYFYCYHHLLVHAFLQTCE